MQMKILFYTFCISTFYSYMAVAQPIIDFKEKVHDFANIPEGSLATHEFTFTNTGNEPLIISSVRASCGCTTPYWTKEPILPGEKGVISASYNSKGRPGSFNKSITVTSNSSQPSTTLSIKGIVVTSENIQKIFSEKELENSPKLELEKIVSHLGKVEKGQSVMVKINLKNTGKTPLVINGIKSQCNCVSIDPSSNKSIDPNKSHTLILTYKPRSLGKTDEVVSLFSNDIHNPEIKVTLNGEIVDNLSQESLIKESGGFQF
jgi:LEA14-like dessication related protein